MYTLRPHGEGRVNVPRPVAWGVVFGREMDEARKTTTRAVHQLLTAAGDGRVRGRQIPKPWLLNPAKRPRTVSAETSTDIRQSKTPASAARRRREWTMMSWARPSWRGSVLSEDH